MASGFSEGSGFAGASDLGGEIGGGGVRGSVSFAGSDFGEVNGSFVARGSVGVNRRVKTSYVSYEPGSLESGSWTF